MEAIRDTPSLPTASRQLEIKTSPTDSLLSEPSDVYPSLFCGSSVASSAAATPADTGDVDVIDFASETGAFTGSLASLAEEALDDLTPLAAADTDNTGLDTSPATGKKPTKKRKSWGQVLPEPKTNLPPRKRAKTEDEKEQRRVERVLRNRRAAQSSRERKRLEVEALEIRNRELEEQLARVRKENSMLYEQLTQAQGTSAVISAAATPVTMSQELFSSQNGCLFTAKSESGLGPLLSSATINPVSLSPALHPTPDPSNTLSSVDAQEPSFQDESAKSPRKIKMEALPEEVQIWSLAPEVIAANGPSSSIAAKLDVSPDMTHRPAATLCPDLQCLSGETSQAWTSNENLALLKATLLYQTTLLLMLSSTVISACSQPLNQIALLLNAGTSIPPTPAIVTTIIWLVVTPSRRSMARNSILMTSLTPTSPISHPVANPSSTTAASKLSGRPPFALRLRLLRKILTCNPMLARPIRDATMRLLRSVSEEQADAVKAKGQVCTDSVGAVQWEECGITLDGSWSNKITRPSKEKLLSLLWVLQSEDRRTLVSAQSQDFYLRGQSAASSKQLARARTSSAL